MKTSTSRFLATSIARLLPVLTLLAASPAARAASGTKLNNNTALNLAGSWSTLPDAAGIGTFNSTSGTTSTSLTADYSIGGFVIGNVTGAPTFNASTGFTLTLGSSGIDMTAAAQNLTSGFATALTGATQTWDVVTARTLTQNGRVNLGSTTLTVQGVGATTFGTAAVVSGSGAIVKNGAGTLTLSHSGNSQTTSTFSGGITLTAGTLAISGTNASGSGLITAGGGTLNISAAQTTLTGGLTISGAAATLSATDIGTGTTALSSGSLAISNATALRNSTVNFTGGTLSFGTLTAGTFGALTGSANLALTNTSSAATALTLGFNNASPSAYTGNLTGLGGIIKTGSGTQILNGANTFAGTIIANGAGGTLELGGSSTSTASTGVQAGTLRLNFNSGAAAVPATNLLASGSTLTLAGGTLSLLGKDNAASSQAFTGATVLTGGTASAVSVTAGAGSGTAFVNLNGFTRNGGTAVDFTLPSGTLSATNGILTTTGSAGALLRSSNNQAFGTIGGTDWAAKDGTNAYVVPFSTLATNYTPATGSSLGTSTQNSDIASGIDTTVSTSVINTIRFAQNQARTLTINSGQTLTVTSSGILISSAVATAGSKITGGNLTSGATPNELVFHQFSSQPFTLDSTVTGSSVALTKAGPGTLILTRANTHGGTTYVSAGTLRIGAGGSLGSSTVAVSNNDPAAIFDVNNQATSVNALSGGSATGGQVNLGTSGALTINGGAGGTLNGALVGGLGSIINKNGAGTTQAFGTSSNLAFYGTVNVNAGILGVNNQASSLVNANLVFASGTTFTSGASPFIGNLNGTGTITNSAGSVQTYGFGYLGGAASFSGVINNGTSGLALQKYGSGTATLSGANTYQGSTTLYSGTLEFDYSTGNDVLAAATPGALTLAGGTAAFKGGTGAALNAETTGAFGLSSSVAAQSNLVLNSNGGAGFTLTLATTTSNGSEGFATNANSNGLLFDTSSSAANVLRTATALGTLGAAM